MQASKGSVGYSRSLFYILVAVSLLSIMTALIKAVGSRYPIGQVVFFRSFFALLLLIPLLPRNGGFAAFETTRPFGHLMRSTAGILGIFCFFGAVGFMPLADVMAVGYTAPLFMTALAGPLLRERAGVARWIAVLLGLGGMLLIVQPGIGIFSVGALLAIGGAVFAALAMISIRHLGERERGFTIVLYFALACTVTSAITLPFGATWPTPVDFGLLIAIGLLGGTAQLLVTRAYQMAPVSVLAPLEYTAILWAIALGVIFWGEIPSAIALVGACGIVAANLLVVFGDGSSRGVGREPRVVESPVSKGVPSG